MTAHSPSRALWSQCRAARPVGRPARRDGPPRPPPGGGSDPARLASGFSCTPEATGEESEFQFKWDEMQSSTTRVTTKSGESHAFGPDITANTGMFWPKALQPGLGVSFQLGLVFNNETGHTLVRERETSTDFTVKCKANKRYSIQVVQTNCEMEIPMTYHFGDGTTAEARWHGQVFSPGRFSQTLKDEDRRGYQ